MVHKFMLLAVLFAGFACAETRVYELRTYTVFPGKLEALKARFRDHTIKIFNRHHIESIGYWVPQGERSKDTLIYIVAHPSLEAATKNWQEFMDDPEWKKAAAESEANGKIVVKMDSVFMDPTDFSKLK